MSARWSLRHVGLFWQVVDPAVLDETLPSLGRADRVAMRATAPDQVGGAANPMDQVTQHNAAMVGRPTAARHTLAEDTDEPAALTAGLQLGNDAGRAAAVGEMHLRRGVRARMRARAAAPEAARVPAHASGWEEF